MLIRLLGQVRIQTPARTVAVAAPKRACVLAALAERPGEAVTQADLVARVWGADPPDSVLSSLYSYVTRLRAELRGAGTTIGRAGGGYVLDIAPALIDVHAVRATAALAQAATDPAEALRHWRAACELATGEPLAGIAGEWAEGQRAALRREHANLHAERRAAELALGNHAAVVAELEALPDDDRHTEATAAQLMLALHRSGRPADALAVFEEVRRRLRDTLGADPSAELRELHLRVLGQDPALAAPTQSTPNAQPLQNTQPPPNTLPAAARSFTGREAELAALDALDGGIALVTGPGGVGKTALAVHWGHTRGGFPGGRLYVNLRGFGRGEPVPAREALGGLLRALGRADDTVPTGLADASAVFRDLTARARTLVILDNARDAGQVRPLLPGAGGLTVVTSRHSLPGLIAIDDARPVPVRTLPPEDSRTLLRGVLGERVIRPRVVARLAELCGHLPLALRIAAANLVTRPNLRPEAYLASFEDTDRLDALAVEGDPDAAVTTVLGHSHRALDADARRLFARLGALPGEDFGGELLSELGGGDVHERLVAAHLLEEYRPGRFRMHDLVRRYAGRRAAGLDEAERHAVVEEFLDWHHATYLRVSAEDEMNAVLAAGALSGHPRLWRGTRRLVNSFNHQRNVTAARRALDLALRRAEADGDEEGVVRTLIIAAAGARAAGEIEESVAMSQRVIPLAERRGRLDVAMVKGNLAMTLLDRDHREAERMAAEAIELVRAEGRDAFHLAFGITLSVLRAGLGRFAASAAALADIDESLGAGLSAAQLKWRAVTEANIFRERLLHADALRVCDEGLALPVEAGAPRRQATLLTHRSAALRGLGRFEEAGESVRRAMALAEAGRMDLWETGPEHALVLTRLGRVPEAIAALEAVEAEPRVPPANLVGRIAHARATILNAHGDHAGAARAAERAVEIFAGMTYLTRQVECLRELAHAHEGLGEPDAAAGALARATALAAGFDEPEVVGRRLP